MGKGRHRRIPCVPARTKDKRRRRLSFVSSVICLADRWRWAAAALLQRFRLEGAAGGKDAGDMGLHG